MELTKAIKSMVETIDYINKELDVTLDDYKIEMLERAKREAGKCLTTLRYINQ